MKKTIVFLNIILTLAVLAGNYCYMEYGGLEIKTPTSCGFVLLGIVNLLYCLKTKAPNIKFSCFIAAGLLFSMLGDVFINIDFITGALVFALGHVFYFIAFSAHMKLHAKDLIPCAVIFAISASIILFVPFFDFGGILMQGVCLFYALVISLMFGKATANYLRVRTPMRLIIVIGCFLFYFSDLMLVFDVFSDAPGYVDTLCLYTYYPAQCLLAHSIFHTTKKEF